MIESLQQVAESVPIDQESHADSRGPDGVAADARMGTLDDVLAELQRRIDAIRSSWISIVLRRSEPLT